jgi:hypothetical protein
MYHYDASQLFDNLRETERTVYCWQLELYRLLNQEWVKGIVMEGHVCLAEITESTSEKR